ncbi:hypothetical protein FNV43_RR01782 [Rhamnella rubrinervis]|uniref:Uncharacterized protein n=1 Tax=Rhamnella rubrinervis TaxID=2594499 RepID=A0A8K0HSS9_9ROSA|nr:hypothetical protein FNV43_RR01782 [Rhamnella rubrinervis]
MAESLFELEQVLLSKQVKLTPQEVNVLLKCRSNIVRDFTVGAVVGAGVGWQATSKLRNLFRLYASGGVAAFFGLWKVARSLHSCYDHMLAMEGSRIQKELAHIMVTKHGNEPWIMQLISKRFCSERVFDDSSPDQPKIRWRYRNIYYDNFVNGQRTQESDSLSNSHVDSHIDYHNDYHSNSQSDSSDAHIRTRNNSDKRRINLEPKQPMNSGIDMMVDPLDCFFDYPATKEEIHHPNISSASSRMHARNHKRSHRRRRRHHHDDSLDSQDAQH